MTPRCISPTPRAPASLRPRDRLTAASTEAAIAHIVENPELNRSRKTFANLDPDREAIKSFEFSWAICASSRQRGVSIARRLERKSR